MAAFLDHSADAADPNGLSVIFKVAGIDVSGPSEATQLPAVDIDTPIAAGAEASAALLRCIADRKAQTAFRAANPAPQASEAAVEKKEEPKAQVDPAAEAKKQLQGMKLELGMSLLPCEDDEIQGMVVMDVVEGKAGDEAGILEEDIIQKLNNVAVSDSKSLRASIDGVSAGDKLPVTLLRALATDSDCYFEDGAGDAEQEFDQVALEMVVGSKSCSMEEVMKLRETAISAPAAATAPKSAASADAQRGGTFLSWDNADQQAIAANRAVTDTLRELQRQLAFITKENEQRAKRVRELESTVDTLTAKNSQLLQEGCDLRCGRPVEVVSRAYVQRETPAQLRAKAIEEAKAKMAEMSPTVGMTLQNSNDPDVPGWVVMDVVDGGAVDEAGVQPDDVVCSINGESVDGKHAKDVLGKFKSGDKIEVRVMRAVAFDSDSYFDEEAMAEQEFDQIDFEVLVGAKGYTSDEVSRIAAQANGM